MEDDTTENKKYISSVLDLFSIPNFYIRKGRPHSHKYGKKGFREFHKFRNVLRSCSRTFYVFSFTCPPWTCVPGCLVPSLRDTRRASWWTLATWCGTESPSTKCCEAVVSLRKNEWDWEELPAGRGHHVRSEVRVRLPTGSHYGLSCSLRAEVPRDGCRSFSGSCMFPPCTWRTRPFCLFMLRWLRQRYLRLCCF